MISIIIIVKNDKKIDDTLKSLDKIVKPEKVEVVVVDASNGLLEDIKKNHPHVHWVYFKNNTNKKITIPEQRNAGVKAASGDKIVFTDAGCVADKYWLEKLYEVFTKEKEDVVAGQALQFNKERFYNDTLAKGKYINQCPTINVMIAKKVFDNVGLFNEKFNYGSDVDFTWRVIDKGYKIRYVEDAIVYHDWGGAQDNLKRAYRYGEARARLYLTHKNRIKYMFRNDFTLLFYSAYLLLLPILILTPLFLLPIILVLIKNRNSRPWNTLMFNLVFAGGAIKEVFTYYSNR